jgi:fructose-1,6-bisphosphatase/inositol monophosphatase family enzyme
MLFCWKERAKKVLMLWDMCASAIIIREAAVAWQVAKKDLDPTKSDFVNENTVKHSFLVLFTLTV